MKKKLLTRIKRILQNLNDCQYLTYNKNIETDGILLVIHESQQLGASLLTLNIAKELKKIGENVYLITREFGALNKQYAEICPTQIIFSQREFKKTLDKLSAKGYKKAIMVTAACGDLVKLTKDAGFKTVSLIHELPEVITMLDLEEMTKSMILESNKVVFSTSVAKEGILKLLSLDDSENIKLKPQGIYFDKPSDEMIEINKEHIEASYPQIKNKKIVVGIGNTSKRKGFDVFIETAKVLPEMIVLWAGKKESYYNEAVKNCEIIPDNFIYLVEMKPDQLSGVYSLANVYFMCSRFDTLPSTIFEALLFNVPVVGWKKSGGIVDLIDDTNGHLNENYDVKEFAASIKSVVDKQDVLSANIRMMNKGDLGFDDYVKFIVEEF